MAKKKTNTPRKRKRLKANPKRQAHASLKGYLYQIWHSVNAWLDLADNEVLYLEGAEDFDILSDDTATATQVKHTQRKITLRYSEVIEAINHYWELRTNNPDLRVKLRFLTRSKITIEHGNPFGKDKPGLELWQRCSGNEAAITKISEFLQTETKISEEVKDFLKQASPQEIYEQLIEPITWETGSKPASFVERSISNKLVLHGNRYSIPIPPPDAKKVIDSLLKEVWTVATQKENRELTKARFLEIFYERTTQNIPTWYLQHLQIQGIQNKVLDASEPSSNSGTTDITIQSQSLILNTIPPSYRDIFPRTELCASIQTKLQSEGIAVIHGGAGKGKTTLAKLIANDINGSWLWLNPTDREPSEVSQLLRQLAIEISNQSSRFNVVLDDLNLQPQHLKKYEDALGVVIYGVLERGGKILITSQYKPPNNLTRSLGVSSSVSINVPNFTESETKQFAEKMGCPTNDIDTWTTLIQAHIGGHPRLVHAWLIRLQEEGWDEQNILPSILQPPEEVIEEREAARQLLANLPKDRREFLYRLSLMPMGFRKDYALNIAAIREPIFHPGDVFSQLVGPWIDPVDGTYYAISPLLKDAAKQVWPENEIKDLHAYIVNAILKTKELTTTEAWAVFTHSMAGQYTEGIIAFIYSLMDVPQNDWNNLCQEFSVLAHIKIDPPEELFPGNAFLNQLFRSLQYRIAAEVEPELAPKILETWDKETKPYEPRQSYLLSRVMLASQVLRYNQVQLPAKQLLIHIKEMIDIKDKDEDVWETYLNSMGQLEEYNTDKSNFFSFLFSFVYVRHDINAAFLNDLIDALDELESENRKLLLADFKDDSIESRLLIDSVWWTEANLEKPDWARCLEVFDKVIERTIAWDYPYIAAASARGKSIIHDEYLKTHDTAQKILQDISKRIGTLPAIEEAQAVVYFNQKRYKESLNIYECLLHKRNPSLEASALKSFEGYQRAATCAAFLKDWGKSATFFEDAARISQKYYDPKENISLYADAGFAHFKADNMLDCIKMLNLALQKFEILPQDNTEVKYFTLKKRLACSIGWIAYHENENYTAKSKEPSVGFCSNPEMNEEVLNLPDSRIEYIWLALARIECKFGHGTTVLDHALQITDQDAHPALSGSLSLLEVQYDFKNKTFDNLPRRIHQLASAYGSMQKHHQTEKGIEVESVDSSPILALSNFASVENITFIFVTALLVQLPIGTNIRETLSTWRTNSLELPIKENIFIALDLIKSMLAENQNNALTAMKTQKPNGKNRFVAALKIVQDKKTNPENLFLAHTFITTSLIGTPWEDFVVIGLVELLSAQWLEKIKFRSDLKTPMLTVPQIEQTCSSSETGKKKIGQILLAAHQAISLRLDPETLQQFRSWAESESKQKQAPATRKNPAAQRLIKAMEKPPHLTNEDIEALNQSIKEGKIPIKFDSPFEPDEPENNE